MASYSGLYDLVYGSGYPGVRASKSVLTQVGILFHGKRGRRNGAIIRQLIAGNVGGTATKTQRRVAYTAASDFLMGKRGTVTETLINRATTSADQALLADKLVDDPRPSSWPKEKSGNSGGGKLGY